MRVKLPKLSRTVRWILTIAIIAAIAIPLGVFYSNKLGEESQLQADVAAACAQRDYRLSLWQLRLNERSEDQSQLEEDISSIADQLDDTESELQDDTQAAVARLSQIAPLLQDVLSGLEDIAGGLQTVGQQLNAAIDGLFPHEYTQSIEISDELYQAADDADVVISSYSCSLPAERTVDGNTYQVFSIGLSIQGEVPNLLDFTNKVSQRFPDCNFGSVSIGMPGEEGGIASMSLPLEIYCHG